MRTSSEIIIALQEQHPVTSEEAKFAALCLSYWASMALLTLSRIAEKSDKPQAVSLLAKERWESFKRMSDVPVDEYLGTNWTPGTPENTEQRRVSKKIYAKAEQMVREKQSGWQPIETAPKDGTEIDLWEPDSGRWPQCRWFRITGDWFCIASDIEVDNPTHWRPIPDGPSS